MFYTIQGDTVFDTLYSSAQWGYYFTLFWCYGWIQFGLFVINKQALAMTEDGYLGWKYHRQFDWLFKSEQLL